MRRVLSQLLGRIMRVVGMRQPKKIEKNLGNGSGPTRWGKAKLYCRQGGREMFFGVNGQTELTFGKDVFCELGEVSVYKKLG